jgi:hypothetical protein
MSETSTSTKTLTTENYSHSFFNFEDRQAGVGLVFSPNENRFYYNAYCLEAKLLKELFSVEHEFLEDALITINDEFGQWELKSHEVKKEGCGTCVAKPIPKEHAF